MQDTQTYELAGIAERFIALLIDVILFSIVGGILGLNISLLGGGLLSVTVGAAYEWYFLTQHNGQTIGKMLMNIRVIKADGTPISDADAILRYVGYYVNSIPFLCMAGWWWALVDSKNQGFQDKIARTYVVKA